MHGVIEGVCHDFPVVVELTPVVLDEISFYAFIDPMLPSPSSS